MNILGAHLGTNPNWGVVRSLIIAAFLPPRLNEKFLHSYVLDRFQSPSEDLNMYIGSVVAAADILGFSGSESQLVHRMLQNMHPRIMSHLLFATKPPSEQELYSLVTSVAEAVAVEDQRKLFNATAQQASTSRPMVKGMVVENLSPAVADIRPICWKCGAKGHLQRNCFPKTPRQVDTDRSGNVAGARR
jgi:hypothetical protein